jgi:hypothetical protein
MASRVNVTSACVCLGAHAYAYVPTYSPTYQAYVLAYLPTYLPTKHMSE